MFELLADVEHLGELCRLMAVFAHRRNASLGRRTVIDLAASTAGAGFRYPRPAAALSLAQALSLLGIRGPRVRLSRLGRHFLDLPARTTLDLSPDQGRLVFSLLMDDAMVRARVADVMRAARRGNDDQLRLRPHAAWDYARRETVVYLQQCGALVDSGDGFAFDRSYESLLPGHLLAPAGLSEEELYRRLDAQRRRARDAEELVKAEEIMRLAEIGRPDLAGLVERVSEFNVAAGYDIQSFNEEDDSPRYIEVKSSTGRRLAFEWSAAEREMADRSGGRYWIYFVPLSQILRNRPLPIVMLQDPLQHIEAGNLIELPVSFAVTTARTDPATDQGPNARLPCLQVWAPPVTT